MVLISSFQERSIGYNFGATKPCMVGYTKFHPILYTFIQKLAISFKIYDFMGFLLFCLKINYKNCLVLYDYIFRLINH